MGGWSECLAFPWRVNRAQIKITQKYGFVSQKLPDLLCTKFEYQEKVCMRSVIVAVDEAEFPARGTTS